MTPVTPMGSYTEFVLSAVLNDDTPADVIQILTALIDRSDETDFPEPLPDHPFFSCRRWQSVMLPHSSSNMQLGGRLVRHHLSIAGAIKNYDGEYRKFVDWLAPYIGPVDTDTHRVKFVGYTLSEEREDPTLLYVTEDNKVVTDYQEFAADANKAWKETSCGSPEKPHQPDPDDSHWCLRCYHYEIDEPADA